jgi:hypothetical protein
MSSFKEFLNEQGVVNLDDLILFLENLPGDPTGMDHMEYFERYREQIDKAFEYFLTI